MDQLGFKFENEVIPQGGDTYLVRPKKVPVDPELSPAEFAKLMDCSRSTVYNWIQSGTIPQQFVRCKGPLKLKILYSAKAHIENHFREKKFGG